MAGNYWPICSQFKLTFFIFIKRKVASTLWLQATDVYGKYIFSIIKIFFSLWASSVLGKRQSKLW
jgi:hypothetical protein